MKLNFCESKKKHAFLFLYQVKLIITILSLSIVLIFAQKGDFYFYRFMYEFRMKNGMFIDGTASFMSFTVN